MSSAPIKRTLVRSGLIKRAVIVVAVAAVAVWLVLLVRLLAPTP